MSQIPDRLYIHKEDRKLYEMLDEEGLLKRTRKEQFMFVMAFGYHNKIKRHLETREGLFLTKDMRLEDEALINAIAINDVDSVEILSNKEEVFKIAEEYAHAGIRLLYDKIKSTQFGSFEKQFEKKIVEIHQNLNLGEDIENDTIG